MDRNLRVHVFHLRLKISGFIRQYWRVSDSNRLFLRFSALLIVLPLTLFTTLFGTPSVCALDQTTEYGFHFASQFVTPSAQQLALLHPQWMRYGLVVPYAMPTFPANIKTLLLFNNESVTVQAPLNSADVAAWRNYVDTGYIPELTRFLHVYPFSTAIEIWNEEDLCSGRSYCPKVPAAGYAYMIKRAASTIKSFNANIQVIMGGLGAGNPDYIRNVRNADASALKQVDAVGIHPYGQSPSGWCTSQCSGILPFGDLTTAIHAYKEAGGLTVWITEVGANNPDKYWQGQYAQKVFLSAAQNNVGVVIWYDMRDSGNSHWGLIDKNNNLKPSGKAFVQVSKNTFVTTQLPLRAVRRGEPTKIRAGDSSIGRPCSRMVER